MNITIVRESLLKILQKSSYFTSNKISDLKVLKAVLINANQDGVVIKTTNINESFSGEIGGKVYKTGSVLVDHKALMEIVKNLNDAKITLEKKQGQLTLIGKAGKIKLLSLNENNFPNPEKPQKTTPLASVLFLEKAVQFALLSCATDEARPILTGLCFDFRENETRLVSTDGFRMSLSRFDKAFPEYQEKKIIISGKSLAAVYKVFKDKAFKASYCKQENSIVFEGGGISIVSKLLDGEFPPYEGVIPQSQDTKIVFKKEDLLQVVRSSSLFAKGGSNMLSLLISEKEVTVSSADTGVGEAVFKIEPVSFEGKENKIVFNYRYLAEYLYNVSSEELVFKMTTAFAPGVFESKKDPGSLYIIMPIRQQE